jgi:hypothetical protein
VDNDGCAEDCEKDRNFHGIVTFKGLG